MSGSDPYVPEVLSPDAELPRDLQALRRFAIMLDAAVPIPGTRRRVGVDAAVGLIPGVGDVIGALLSGWIVVAALRHRVPASRIARMMVNILIDLGIGSIPFFGDLFDVFWKPNINNTHLLFQYRDRQRPPRSTREIALIAFLLMTILFVASVTFVVLLILAIVHLVGRPLL